MDDFLNFDFDFGGPGELTELFQVPPVPPSPAPPQPTITPMMPPTSMPIHDEHSANNQQPKIQQQKPPDPPPPPPVIICPTEVDHINVTLEKNQQCACKDCGKLFNSVWYLKQHAVKHSNDRPFKCKFCYKTYKFRSNLYQHKCPDRQKRMLARQLLVQPNNPKRLETNQILKSRLTQNMENDDFSQGGSDSEDNEGISFGLCIRVEQPPPMEAPIPPPPPPQPVPPPRPFDSVRDVAISRDRIESYLAKNKHKLHPCRKCKLQFASDAHLARHVAAHARLEKLSYACASCPQRFATTNQLKAHQSMHTAPYARSCPQCHAGFSQEPTMVRLSSHFEESSQMESTTIPLDAWAFIDSEDDAPLPLGPLPSLEHCVGDNTSSKGPDSGVGSDASPHSYSTSPSRSTVHMDLEDELEVLCHGKRKEEDEESGFRSRLNSVTQSCSPGSSSAFSSDGGSPLRKLSSSGNAEMANGYRVMHPPAPYGHGPHTTGYGTQLKYHHYEQAVGGERQLSMGFDDFTSESPADLDLGIRGAPSTVGLSLRAPRVLRRPGPYKPSLEALDSTTAALVAGLADLRVSEIAWTALDEEPFQPPPPLDQLLLPQPLAERCVLSVAVLAALVHLGLHVKALETLAGTLAITALIGLGTGVDEEEQEDGGGGDEQRELH